MEKDLRVETGCSAALEKLLPIHNACTLNYIYIYVRHDLIGYKILHHDATGTIENKSR